jgi:hypothetical protein
VPQGSSPLGCLFCCAADERSPLCGHTHDSLMALNAEVVVTFEGTTEVRLRLIGGAGLGREQLQGAPFK